MLIPQNNYTFPFDGENTSQNGKVVTGCWSGILTAILLLSHLQWMFV